MRRLLAYGAIAAASAALAAPMMTPWGEKATDGNAWRGYPRPQMQRANWTNLNGEWDYAITSVTNTYGRPSAWDGKIRVPFALEAPLSGCGGRLLEPHEYLWYTRKLDLDPKPGERILLHFGAVDFRAIVYLGHDEVTATPHEGGQLPFTVDLTPYAKKGENTLTVLVWDPTEDFVNSCGKQSFKPHACFYTRMSGIWQTVWMETVPEKHVADYDVVTDIDAGTVTLTFKVDGLEYGDAAEGSVRVLCNGGKAVAASFTPGVPCTIKLPQPVALWSPETPSLYDFTAKFGKDEVKGYFGMRKFEKRKDANGILRFYLNNRPYFVMGTLDQGWWPDGLLTPPSEEAMAFDIKTLKDCGFNAMRKHIKVEPLRYYALCDRMGLLLLQDMPSTTHSSVPDHNWSLDKDPFHWQTVKGYSLYREELKGLVDLLRKVPSIVVWVPYNEGWSQHDPFLTHTTLDFVKKYDPTRLVDGPSGWCDFEGGRTTLPGKNGRHPTQHPPADACEAADIVDHHEYRGPGMIPVCDRRVSFLGEFGGLGHPVEGHLWHESDQAASLEKRHGNWGYGGIADTKTPEGLEKTYLGLMDRLGELAEKGLAGSIYTQTTDVEIEINGLLTYDRKVLKYRPEVLRKAHGEVCRRAAAASAARTCAEIATSAGKVRITSPSAGALRVTRGEPVSPELVFVSAGSLPVDVSESGDETKVRSGGLSAVVSRKTGLVRFEGPKGAVLRERDVGAKSAAFDSPKGERLYGLGQFQDGVLDVRNLPRRLVQVNTQISSPFLVSTRGWGLYWHTYSKVDFNPCRAEVALGRKGDAYEGEFDAAEAGEYAFMLDCGAMAKRQFVEIDGKVAVDNSNYWLPPCVGFRVGLAAGRHRVRVLPGAGEKPVLSFRRDCCETRFETDSPRDGTDYVVYLGEPESVVARFRADAGGTAALPDWAWGYWHCQERFRSQEELLAAVKWFKDRDLPLSVVVQDWQWWRSGTWNSMEWDSKRYPDPKAMADECHANGVKVMLSVWSKTAGKTAFRSELAAAKAFVPGTEWIDFSNPTACDIYWKWFDKCCVKKGIDAFWLDAVEPENDALHGRKLALGDGDVYRNVFPLLVNREADRRLRALRPGETPLVLTRCAFAGQQRTSCVMWSGDVGSSWDALRRQVVAGLGFAAAGFPYWTSDAGGFFRPGDQYANGEYHKVLARWVEFATFCPIQRVHGYKSDTTPSRFGPEMEKLLCDQIRLRERLRPYILETARAVASENAMFMRPLWEAPAGFETEYMFGGKMLVCPVVADVGEMDVWIPEGEWRDFHTGEAVKGGCVRRVKTPIDRIPVFVK